MGKQAIIEKRVKLKYAFLRMRHYLKENGCQSNGLTNRKVAKIFADMKYSETITNTEWWVLSKVDAGDFKDMKTGRTAKPAKRREAGVPVVKRTDYKTFIRSDYWGYVRKLVLTRDGNKCTRCGATKSLHAHHLTYEHHFNEHKHISDLITLCITCHRLEHKRLREVKKELSKKYNLPI